MVAHDELQVPVTDDAVPSHHQDVHTDETKAPTSAGVHAVAPGLLYALAAQLLQDDAFAAENWPAAQAEQALAPALENEPAAHAKQLASEAEPVPAT